MDSELWIRELWIRELWTVDSGQWTVDSGQFKMSTPKCPLQKKTTAKNILILYHNIFIVKATTGNNIFKSQVTTHAHILYNKKNKKQKEKQQKI